MNAVFNKFSRYFVGFSLLFFVACGNGDEKRKLDVSFDENPPKEGIVSIQTIRKILRDIIIFQEYLKEDTIQRESYRDSLSKTAYALLLKKYRIDTLTLRKSFVYYGSDIDTTAYLLQDTLLLDK